MRASKVDDKQVWQLIKNRIDGCGIDMTDIAVRNPGLAHLIKRGIAGDPVPIEDDELYQCVQLFGLISHRHASGHIPSRDELIALFKYGGSSYPRQCKLVDWGCE